MKISDLMTKIDNLNKLNKELGFEAKYYVVLYEWNWSPTYLYSKKDLKEIKEKYIGSIADMILNTPLVKEETYYYSLKFDDKEYEVRIGI